MDLAGLGRLTLNVQAVGYPALGDPVDGLLDRLVTEILPGIPGRASERGTPPSSGCCIVAMFTLAITVWLTANPAAPPHIVYSSPTPWSVCAGMADKLNIPLLFPREISMRADCLPYQPPQN